MEHDTRSCPNRNTPNLVSNENGYAAFVYTEISMPWQVQLKFPLIQYYLAENIFKCPAYEVEIGTYCLTTSSFDMRKYTTQEMESAISETKGIFELVYKRYNKK